MKFAKDLSSMHDIEDLHRICKGIAALEIVLCRNPPIMLSDLSQIHSILYYDSKKVPKMLGYGTTFSEAYAYITNDLGEKRVGFKFPRICCVPRTTRK